MNGKKLFFAFFLVVMSGWAGATTLQDLDTLNVYLEQKPMLDAQKQARIDAYVQALDTISDRYLLYDALFEEYKSYNFDKASLYVDKLLDEAVLQGDKDKIVHAHVQKGFGYLSAGLFKECADLFEDLDTVGASESTRQYYCLTYARLLYDMADYDHAGLTHSYNQQGDRLLEESKDLLSLTDTALYWYCLATLDAKQGKYRLAVERLNLSLEDTRISEHQKAINYSTMAYLYSNLGEMDLSQHYNILAAISDIKSSTKETVALRQVAKRLYEEGEVKLAGKYVRVALEDAKFYNARHRQLEIGQILPIIEQENMQDEKRQKKHIYILASVSLGLFVVVLFVMMFALRRNKALLAARRTIEQMNDSLFEANKIKEEYIGSLLCWQSDFLGDMEKYQQFVHKNAVEKRYAELLSVPRQFSAPKKREEFYKHFDEMFLHIFPNFVRDFNSLLRPEERIYPKDGELLNTDLRIAALLRLGISHNEVIAQVLDYSVNTIYTYKTRLRSKTDLSPADLADRLMKL